MKMACNSYCNGCIYKGRVSFNTPCCDYIFIEDKMRPCPPGEGCTVKTTDHDIKRKKTAQRKELSFEQKQRKAQRDKEYREKKRLERKRLCRYCGNEFTPSAENKLFCSKECAIKKNAEDRKVWEILKNEKRKAERKAAKES